MSEPIDIDSRRPVPVRVSEDGELGVTATGVVRREDAHKLLEWLRSAPVAVTWMGIMIGDEWWDDSHESRS